MSQQGEKKCVICGFDRIVDRCHIIPKRLLHGLRGYKKYASFDKDNPNLVFLCRNHHVLFDIFRLNEEEMKLLEPHIEAVKKDIVDLLNSDLNTYKKYKNDDSYKKACRAFNSWKKRAGDMFVELNYLVKNN